MNFPYGLLPAAWHWAALLVLMVVTALALRGAPWSSLRGAGRLHVFLGTCVALMLLWSIRAWRVPGLEYHFLGATLVTLMFGWRLALLALVLVLTAHVLNGTSDWQTFPMNLLTMGLVPIAVSHFIWRLAETHLPANFFVYIFACAFFGAGLAMLTVIFTGSGLLWIGGAYASEQLYRDYLQLIPLFMFPEAFITGLLMTLLIVYRPEWVTSFDDRRYLAGK